MFDVSNFPSATAPWSQEKVVDGQRVAATLHCTTKEEIFGRDEDPPVSTEIYPDFR